MVANSVKIASVFVGSFIGAGFASGQEILSYFAIYGGFGAAGAVVSGVIFGCFCYFCTFCCYALGKEDFLKAADFGGKIEYIFVLFMVLMFCAMSNACGELFLNVFSFPKAVGCLVLTACSLPFLLCGERRIVRLNLFAAPVVGIGIFAVCAFKIFGESVAAMSCAAGSAVCSSVLYVAYNALTFPGLTFGVADLIDSPKTVAVASVFCGTALGGMILTEWYVLHGGHNFSEIPILDVLGGMARFLYFPVLFLAILTSAVSNGYGASVRFKSKKTAAALLFVVQFAFLGVEFSFIVKYLYKIFAIAGAALIVNAVFLFLKVRKNEKNGKLHKKTK